MAIGDNIRVARLANGMTLDELAKNVGVSKQAISAFENNRKVPKSSTLVAIKKFLNVSLDYIMSNENVSVENACRAEVKRATISELERRDAAKRVNEA